VGLKAYIGFSLLFILIIGIAVFSIEAGYYEVSVYDITFNFPVVVWMLIPVIVLFVLSLFHLFFYGTINYWKKKAFVKDEATFISSVRSFLLQKNEKFRFKTKGYKSIFRVLSQLKLDVKDVTFTSGSEDLNKAVAAIKDIKAGKYVNDKSLKLNENSELAKQNLINKVKEQVDFSLDVLKKVENYPEDVVKIAFLNVLKNKAMTTVKKVYANVKLDRQMAHELFLKDVENVEFGLTKEEILKITKSLNYSKTEYIALAKLYKQALTPDKLIELFETLSEENDEALDSYLYVLSELEMIDKVREVLNTQGEKDCLAFRALLDLKEAGKQYSLDDICYNK